MKILKTLFHKHQYKTETVIDELVERAYNVDKCVVCSKVKDIIK